jgi:hypothetical protein
MTNLQAKTDHFEDAMNELIDGQDQMFYHDRAFCTIIRYVGKIKSLEEIAVPQKGNPPEVYQRGFSRIRHQGAAEFMRHSTFNNPLRKAVGFPEGNLRADIPKGRELEQGIAPEKGRSGGSRNARHVNNVSTVPKLLTN